MTSDGTVEQYGLADTFETWSDVLRAFVHQNGGSIFDDDFAYQETISMADQEAFQEAVQFAADLVLKHKVAPTGAANEAIEIELVPFFQARWLALRKIRLL